MAEGLSTGEAGKLLGLSARRIHQLIQDGQLDAKRTPGGHWRVSGESIERELERRQQDAGWFLSRLTGPASPEPLQDQSDALKREISRLEAHLEDVRAERDRLLQQMQAERDHLRQQIQWLRQDIADLREENQELKMR